MWENCGNTGVSRRRKGEGQLANSCPVLSHCAAYVLWSLGKLLIASLLCASVNSSVNQRDKPVPSLYGFCKDQMYFHGKWLVWHLAQSQFQTNLR